MTSSVVFRSWFTAALLWLFSGCAGGLRPFPLEEPLWIDPDRKPFTPAPEESYSGLAWDAADQTFFRPIARFFAVDPGGEAVNVNAMDEVPASSWFQPRMGFRPIEPDRFALAACKGPVLDPARGPWIVSDAKPNGANPGFIIEGPHGRKYLLKFDGISQAERATCADVLGSIFYWGAGYYAPCNRIVYFDPEVLRIAEDAVAQTESGDEEPMNWSHVRTVLDKGVKLEDGRYRASASRFIEGRPLGPWQYQGTRDDDPNDVVPHQDRRDLRGAYVLASWINHFDSREQNTLSSWITAEAERGYVRHYYIDFGDSLGSMWDWDAMSRRLGYSNYFDFHDVFLDLLTFGLLDRPWHPDNARRSPAYPTFGYFGVERFEPDAWTPGYPNPAFGRMTERDAAWMARILAHYSDAHVRAAVRECRLTDPFEARVLERTLIGRRDAILARWLTELSPLTQPAVRERDGREVLCLRDLGVYAGLVTPQQRAYRTRAWALRRDEPVSIHRPSGDGRPAQAVGRDEPRATPAASSRRGDRDEDVCFELPDARSALGIERNAYVIMDVTALSAKQHGSTKPVRVHLYQVGADRYRVVGLQRPYDDTPPE